MSYDQIVAITRELKDGLASFADNSSVYNFLTSFIAKKFKADLVTLTHLENAETYFYPPQDESAAKKNTPLLNANQGKIFFAGSEIELPAFISDTQKSRANQSLLDAACKRDIKSLAAILIYSAGRPLLLVEIAHKTAYFKWRREDMFVLEQICSYVDVVITSKLNGHSGQKLLPQELLEDSVQGAENSYQRLARYGNLLFVKISPSFQIIEILGDTQKILGLAAKDLLKNNAIWQRYLKPADVKRLRRNFARMRFMQQEFSDELHIHLDGEGNEKILFVQAIPIYDSGHDLLFWEGLAMDITEKRKAETRILNQSKRIEALYEIAQSTQVYHDPSLVMLKGLRAIMKATHSDAGLGCFYDGKSKRIEIAALEGVSQSFLHQIENRISNSTLVSRAIESRQCMNIRNLQDEPIALLDIVRKEGLMSTLVVPLVYDDEVSGIVILYRREIRPYEDKDLDLVTAAATQIAIASRQAEYFIAEKRQARSMSLLYRISHELSKYTNPKDIAQHSFALIQKHFACKRMWFGMLSEQGTHLAGLAGFGPGVRKRLTDIQVELYLRHDFLDEALNSNRPVIVKAGQEMECSGLNLLLSRLEVGAFVIIPLIALNQTVGVIILEPTISSEAFIEKNLPLLTRIADEIATSMLARRFEAKIAEADKMRMAGLLASGVAHNFNNLLQAIMGQASLLEMQLPKDGALSRSARMIVDAAGKGAGLVNQLLNFSNVDNQSKREMDVKSLFQDSLELYRSIVGGSVEFNMQIEDNLPKIEVDYPQFQQVMSNLVVNAREAIGGKSGGRITIRAAHSRLMTGEVDPELAPGEYVRIDIQDNGVGMDEEKAKRCFEPFYSSKSVDSRNGIGFSGSGLGLSYAYSIMKQHAGLITVRSQPAHGSVFSLYFPAALKHQEEKSPADPVTTERNLVFLYDLDSSVQATIKPIFASMELVCENYSSSMKPEKITARPGMKLVAMIVDVDKESFQTIPFLQAVQKQNPELLFVVLTHDVRRWSNILNAFPRLYVVSKPLNVWGIHALARKIEFYQKQQSLTQEISMVTENNPEQTGTESQALIAPEALTAESEQKPGNEQQD